MPNNKKEHLRILHVTRQFYPAVGGIESVVAGLSSELNKMGHKSDVITLNKVWGKPNIKLINEENIENSSVIRLPYFGNQRYAISLGVLKLIRNYDIVHIHSADFFLDYLAFTKVLHKIPLILHTHGLYFHTPYGNNFKRFYLKTITKFAIRQVNQVICVSRHDQKMLKGITSQDKLNVIPNGIDNNKFIENGELRFNQVILSVGRLAVNKRYPLLLKTFADLLPNLPDSKLVIIGEDQGELSALLGLAKELGIEKKVEFLGEVSDATLWNWLKIATIWVTASSYESFGVALMEAMAAGCIPVVQRLDAFEDFIEDGMNGFFTDFSIPLQASVTILSLFQLNDNERQKIINRGKETAKRFGWEKIAVQVQEVYFKAHEQ